MGRDSHDVDFALDTDTGVRFATLVNEFLVSSGHHVSKVGTIAANPACASAGGWGKLTLCFMPGTADVVPTNLGTGV